MLLLTLREIYNRLSSFQNLRRNGGKFDHRPERPATPVQRRIAKAPEQIPATFFFFLSGIVEQLLCHAHVILFLEDYGLPTIAVDKLTTHPCGPELTAAY